MARLVYCATASLDGYVADAEGSFDWAAPDEEVHGFVNDLMRPVGTYLHGRRMYEVMRYRETAPEPGDTSPASRDFARIWRDADKVVYSTTLEPRVGARTRVERGFDPAELRRMKDGAQPLRLFDVHRFSGGVVSLHYRAGPEGRERR